MIEQNRKQNVTSPPGPAPERVKIDGDWTEAVKKALTKKPPAPAKRPKAPKKP